MGLLSRKPKIGIEEFCREFYDTQIFHPIIAGTDVGSVFLETVFNSVSEADQSFAVIDPALFQREITALRMELFGLAWCHKFKREEFMLQQSFFTKRYLEDNGRREIWDIMGEYNQAITRSAYMTASGEQIEAGRAILINKSRADMGNRWAETNIGNKSITEDDKERVKCVARAVNRIGTEDAWDKGITVQALTARLAARLRCREDLKSEALFRLSAVISGLYHGAKEAIKSVNLQVR